MKTITTREFYHSPAWVRSLRPGQSLLVTSNGHPDFVVTKSGNRPKKSVTDIEREAAEIFPTARPQVNTLAIIRELRR